MYRHLLLINGKINISLLKSLRIIFLILKKKKRFDFDLGAAGEWQRGESVHVDENVTTEEQSTANRSQRSGNRFGIHGIGHFPARGQLIQFLFEIFQSCSSSGPTQRSSSQRIGKRFTLIVPNSTRNFFYAND